MFYKGQTKSQGSLICLQKGVTALISLGREPAYLSCKLKSLLAIGQPSSAYRTPDKGSVSINFKGQELKGHIAFFFFFSYQ